ncbi:hypothetical protein CAPTEDRAFT_202725 [Capitella teleta]|uniref:LRRCT domain-containing protein n=1 Tax=Capitella teleta TaxID=283909 RepID=R7T7R4_CAPTE|nr:hypothetical protein CAPTEDRAFT_202725 [Capitella teleta]|eukprot:ELT89473.1 hypothetical protein CAPTEDRAFT_202725 [Capitella teleta]
MELLFCVLLFSSPWQQTHCVNLSNGNLTFVPLDIPRYESGIDLSYNSITTVEAGDFSGFDALDEIDLRYNSITAIDNQAFVNSTIGIVRLGHNQFEEFPYFQQDTVKEIYIEYNNIMNFDLFLFMEMNPSVEKIKLFENKLQNVILNHNSTAIVDFVRSKCNLINIHFGKNDLEFLDPGLFNGITSLKYLTLNYNILKTSVGCDVINGTSIEDLKLAGNQITTFPDLRCIAQTLKNVDLDKNKIRILHSTFIEELTNLITLDLSRNAIACLDELPAWTQSSSLLLTLSGNPLKCDCRWEWLFFPSEAWREIRERMVPAEEVACLGGPHFLSLMPWANLTQSEICPHRQTDKQTDRQNIYCGKNKKENKQ